MNIPTPADPELLLARECAATTLEGRGLAALVAEIRAGEHDDFDMVLSALAAIRATTEAAENDALSMTQKFGDPNGSQYDQGQNDMGARIVLRLRANKHIKGSDDV